MDCNIVNYTIQSKEKGAVSGDVLAPSSTYVRSLYTVTVQMSKVLIHCSRLSIPANQNSHTRGDFARKDCSDPLKRLKQAMRKTYQLPYDVMMVLNRRKRLSRGNGGAFKNADRLYRVEICFPLNRTKVACNGLSGVYGNGLLPN